MQDWQQAQDLQKREAEAAAQRAGRARQAAAAAAATQHAGDDALAQLGLSGSPSPHRIRVAYKRLALLHHPDKRSGSDAAASLDSFLKITAAYQLLLPR